MAKSRAPSKHSRAVRRATSPSIDTDKSLKEIKPPPRPAARPSVLAVHQSAGVSKKTKPARKAQMSAKARRRHEKGLEMAEAVTERTGKKLKRSFDKARTVTARSRAWEDINRQVEEGDEEDDDEGGKEESKKGKKKKAKKSAKGVDEEEQAWETDEEMDAPTADAQLTAEAAGAPVSGTRPQSSFAALPNMDDDDDVIL